MQRKKLFKIILLGSLLYSNGLLAAPSLLAANYPTNLFDPGRVGKQVQQSTPEFHKIAPKTIVQKPAATSGNTAKLNFKLKKVIIKGSTVFRKDTFEALFAPSINKTISVADLQKLTHQVTVTYRKAGYVLSQAILPPQTIKDGVLKIQIIEGFVDKITIKSESARVNKLLAGYAKRIMKSKPLNVHVLQRYMLLANDLPGVTVRAILTPAKEKAAAADLSLLVTQKRISAFLNYDNYGTRYIGPNSVTLGINANSVFAAGDSNSVQFATTTRPSEMKYAGFTHAQPLGSDGLRMQVGANYTETRPGFVLAPVDIIGRNNTVTADLSYPWIRDRSRNFVTHVGASYQNVASSLIGQPFYTDKIRSMIVGGTFDNVDRLHGINTVGVDMTHGFNILGAKDHVNQSRPSGHSQFTRLNMNLQRQQGLSQRFSVLAALHSQYAYQSLLATEQFGFGGSEMGRGYDPSEIVGDHGLEAKVELRMDTNPDFTLLRNVQYYAFYDAGVVWSRDSANLAAKQTGTSTGVGARFGFMSQLTGNLFLAKPLTHKVATLTTLDHNPNQARVFFQLSASL